jgi:serine/threonine protein kinase
LKLPDQPGDKPPSKPDEKQRKSDEKAQSDPLLDDSMVFSDRKNLDDYIIGKQIG